MGKQIEVKVPTRTGRSAFRVTPTTVRSLPPPFCSAVASACPHTHTPATNTRCVAISEETSLWREGANKCTTPEAQPGCMHKQQGSTSGGDFERPKAVQVSQVCMLGIALTTLVGRYARHNFQWNFYTHH